MVQKMTFNHRRVSLICSMALIWGTPALISISAGATATVGQIDATYGQGGVGRVSPQAAAFSRDHAASMVRDPSSGRLYSVFDAGGPGGQDSVIGVAELTATGAPDASFGTGGYAAFDPTVFGEAPVAATLDGAGRLVISGHATANGATGDRPLLVRIRA